MAKKGKGKSKAASKAQAAHEAIIAESQNKINAMKKRNEEIIAAHKEHADTIRKANETLKKKLASHE